jgi:hypothetical protein
MFLAVLSQFLAFRRNFLISKKKVDRVDLFDFGDQNMKKKHQKVHWIDLHSPGNGLVKHLFFMFSLKKSQKYKFWKKNHRKSWIFDSGTVIQIVSAGILSQKLAACYYIFTSDPSLVPNKSMF